MTCVHSVAGKYMCVIVKHEVNDAFIVTAYFADTIKRGVIAWGKMINIWYDREADFLEVAFEQKAGYFKETDNDAIMEKVDDEGNVLGFSILRVSALQEREPFSLSLSVERL